jgi:hypothetical protein
VTRRAASPPGGGGRTPGSRNRRVRLVDHLPPDAFARLAASLLEQALEGDVAAAKLLVDRYDPAPRLAPGGLALFPRRGIGGARQAFDLAGEALAAAARGEVGLEEAGAVLDGAGRLAGLHEAVVLEERDGGDGKKARGLRQVSTSSRRASGRRRWPREEAAPRRRAITEDEGFTRLTLA